MITLHAYNFTHFPFLNYGLDDEQILYTATVPVAVERLRQRNLKGDFSAHSVTIFYHGTPAGFFILDFGSDKRELSGNPTAVLLRSLSINPKLQGKGIGKRAMQQIPQFISKNFPQTTEIVLAVNENNTAARRLYEKCGYEFHGKTREGRSGLQRIMIKFL